MYLFTSCKIELFFIEKIKYNFVTNKTSVKLVFNYETMENQRRVEYWHEWSEEAKNDLMLEVKMLKEKLNTTQLEMARKQIELCLVNFEDAYGVIHMLACDMKRDHDVHAYVDRSIDYIKYMCQVKGFYEGLMCGIHNEV